MFRRFGLIGESVSLGVGFAGSKFQVGSSVSLFLLPEDLDVELSATLPPPCLPVCHQSWHADNGLNLRNSETAQLNAFFHKSCCGHVASS